MSNAKVVVTDNLSLVVPGEVARLTPSQGFRLAEQLIRRSTAQMVAEEAGIADGAEPTRPRVRGRA